MSFQMRLFSLPLLALAFVLCAISLPAQTAMEDVVYLKNGGILRGSVLEQIPNQTLKIETIGRNVFVVQMSEVERIVKEPIAASALPPAAAPSPKPSAREEDPVPAANKRLSIIVEGNAGFLVSGDGTGLRNNGGAAFGFQAALDYHFSPSICLGVGGGADQIAGSWFFPLYADFRYFITQRSTTPYFSVSAGFAMGEAYDVKDANGYTLSSLRNNGGLYASPTFGIRWNASPKAGLILGVGPRLQMMRGAVSVSGYKTYFSSALLLGNLKLGMVF